MLAVVQAKTVHDLRRVAVLFHEYARSLGFDVGFQNFEQELASLPGDYAPPQGRLLIAFWQRKVAGCVGLRDLGGGVCEMKRLYVRRQFRGLGIGRALAEAIIEEARRIGYEKMRLDTVASVARARSLYWRLGFAEIDPYRYNPIEGAIFMELTLIHQRLTVPVSGSTRYTRKKATRTTR
jgi:putative acetyltransferase